ncbi:MAG: hypothetical protein LBC67_05090 [Spirochaetales bacterium]|jgi:hypothetical protein|nr:hypothetical protein [Spirochaetales bacterium]
MRRSKKSRGRRWAAVFICALLYSLVFPVLSGRELFLLPAWTTAADAEPSPQADGEDDFAFRLSGLIGYADSRGRLLYREKLIYGAALHPEYFINYPSVPLNLLVRGKTGEFTGSIEASGYPFIKKNNLFVISPDGYGLSRYEPDGRLVWEKKFPSLITSADSGKGATVVGLLSGGAAVLSEDGVLLHEAAPLSGDSVSLQAGMAADGGHFALVIGGSSLGLSLFARQEGGYLPVYSAPLSGSYRRVLAAKYFSSPDFFIFEQPAGAGFFDVEKRRLFDVELSGQLASVADQRVEGLFFTLSREEEKLYGSAFLPDGNRVFEFSFPHSFTGGDASYFLHAAENYFILGSGGRLYRIDVRIN